MQTFLPYASFAKSAACLDDLRLGKQRVEAKQIYLALTQIGYGWQNHPAVKMWRGYEKCLAAYGYTVCHEWISRGFNDSLKTWFDDRMGNPSLPRPSWLGDEEFHLSHQSNLCRKAPWHYRDHFPTINMSIPYKWPVP